MVVQHQKAKKNQREFKVNVNVILRGKSEHQLEEKKKCNREYKKAS